MSFVHDRDVTTDTLRIRFHKDVEKAGYHDGKVRLDIADWQPLIFAAPTPALAESILALAGPGATLDDLLDIANERDQPEAREQLLYYLGRFARGQFLEWALPGDGGDRLRIESRAKNYAPYMGVLPETPVRLSRFAYLRREQDAIVMESPMVDARVHFPEDGFDWLRGGDCGAAAPTDDTVVRALWRAGFIEPADRQESNVERCWAFHDRLFHEESRGRNGLEQLGADYRFQETFPSLPAVKPAMPGQRLPLPQVDLAAVERRSSPLVRVMETRTSRRDYDSSAPIAAADLAELLYRVARTRKILRDERQDLLDRPYPSGGAIYELEFYLAVRQCDGLDAGFYHYDGHRHALTRIAAAEALVTRMLERSAQAMVQPDGPPQVLVILSARLPRMSWKYSGMAYRAAMAHVGVVYQSLYLVATDMNLAACANGAGSRDEFREATGLDPLEECAMGEFALGRPAPAG